MEKEVKSVQETIVSPKGREAMRRILYERFPDKQYMDNDEADIDDFLNLYSGLSDRYAMNENVSRRIAESIRSNPSLARVFGDIIDKRNPAASLVMAYGKDILNMDPGSEDFAAIVEAEDERAKRYAQALEEADMFDQNLQNSEEVFQQFAASKGMNENDFADFFSRFYDMFGKPILEGIYTLELLEYVYKALNYDMDLMTAEAAGEVKGRNMKIVEHRNRAMGDGIPALGGSGAIIEQKKTAPVKRQSIWDKI